MNTLHSILDAFCRDNSLSGKGALSVVLVITRQAMRHPFPLDGAKFKTSGKGQVLGLNRNAVQAILKDHGIDKVLAEEGGRTSRGSLGKMESYIGLLNRLHEDGELNLQAIEDYWVNRVKLYFASLGIKLKYDHFKTTGSAIDDILYQAEQLQKEDTGTKYVGAVLHYLVGAKLKMCSSENLDIRGYSVSDQSSGTFGDFDLGDMAIHVTVHPSEALIRKCQQNLESGKKPMIVSTHAKIPGVKEDLRAAGLQDRVEVVDGPQFIALNLYEKASFSTANDKAVWLQLVEIYNEAVSEPHFKIRFR